RGTPLACSRTGGAYRARIPRSLGRPEGLCQAQARTIRPLPIGDRGADRRGRVEFCDQTQPGTPLRQGLPRGRDRPRGVDPRGPIREVGAVALRITLPRQDRLRDPAKDPAPEYLDAGWQGAELGLGQLLPPDDELGRGYGPYTAIEP